MLKQILTEECIQLNLQATNKEAVIDELIALLAQAGKITDQATFKQAILAREAQSSTGLESGIAIPHAKSTAVTEPSIVFGLSQKGIDYQALDGEPSQLFFMIAVPNEASNTHLDMLSSLSTMLMNAETRVALLSAKSAQDVFEALGLSSEDLPQEKAFQPEPSTYDVLAVTACPVGIAHTYMAAEALRQKALEMNVSLKIETNGATGIKNPLTPDDIKHAKAIIIAADKQVEMARFDGKLVEIVPVADGIKRPEALIKNAMNQTSSRYQTKAESGTAMPIERKGFYKHLMNGVSHMLPFVVGGGILIAISFIFGIKAADPNDPSFHPIAKILMDIGGANAFFLMIPVLAGFIGMSIADRPGFAPAMVAGLIASSSGAGFLGALVGGFLGGYVTLGLKKSLISLPASLEGIKSILLYPLLGILITGILMLVVVVEPITFINETVTLFLNGLGKGNLVLLGMLLGAMMATDMGGPINKSAFTFGIAAISAGNYAPQAAIMAGGMVPPLAIALATTFLKSRFNQAERDAGKVNYIMGASFITEGAIPFAAADPMRIIPACMLGAALAGGLTMFFGNLLPAPHGGIFVLPIITHPFLYIVSVLMGSSLSAIIIGLLRPVKPIT